MPLKLPQKSSFVAGAAIALGCLVASPVLLASSHREAPFITSQPKVDGTDFYMFRSYGDDASTNSVTFIANYDPLQDAYGAPNFFQLDPNAIYEIHIDNTGDGVEDITYQFQFKNEYNVPKVPAGTDLNGNEVSTTVPLLNIAPNATTLGSNLSVEQTYTVNVIDGPRSSAPAGQITNADDQSSTFTKPLANIGNKSFPDYANYASQYMYDVSIPGCADGSTATGKLFVGQRKEGFVVNLGEVFDLVNQNGATAPVAPGYARDAGENIIADKNITSLALQVPVSCVTAGANSPSIGGWTTASLPQAEVLNPAPETANRGPANTTNNGASVRGGPFSQVSRLGSPLVNEVVIGLDQKDRFNASVPSDDAQFLQFVTNPSLPVLINALFSVPPPATPRTDLVAAFLTGLKLSDSNGNVIFSNQVGSVTPSEMLRLNTSVTPVPLAQQDSLGLLACDTSGFPNGRRPYDDVVDIELTAAEGALTGTNGLQTCDVSTGTPTVQNPGSVVTDGALPNRADYDSSFPYLQTPLPGSPN